MNLYRTLRFPKPVRFTVMVNGTGEYTFWAYCAREAQRQAAYKYKGQWLTVGVDMPTKDGRMVYRDCR